MAGSTQVKDFRKTANGIKLGKMLFDGKLQNKLVGNPALIASLLRQAGLPVPKGVVVTADVAQVVMSGGSMITAIDKANDIKSVLAPSAATLRAAVNLMTETGLMKKDEPAAQIMTLGADLGMVLASGGLNILADIALIMDVYQIAANWSGAAQRSSDAALNNYLRNRRAGQIQAMKRNFVAYQEGRLGTFGLMGKIAEESPDMFLSYYPEMATFIPSQSITIRNENTSTSWWGDTQTAHSEAVIQTIFNDHRYVQAQIVNKYVNFPLNNFVLTKTYETNHPKFKSEVLYPKVYYPEKEGVPWIPQHQLTAPFPRIPIEAFCALSMIPPYVQIMPFGMDIGDLLENLSLTPGDLDENFVHKVVDNQEFFPDAKPFTLYDTVYKDINPQARSYVTNYSPITINGVDMLPKSNMEQKTSYSQAEQNLIHWDKNGMIGSMRKNAKMKQAIKEWGVIPRSAALAGTTKISGEQGSQYISGYDLIEYNIDIQIFWSALAYMEQMKKDGYFNDYDFVLFPWWNGALERIKTKHKELLYKVTSRKLNQMAAKNISLYLGIPMEKMKRQPLETGKLGVYYGN